MSNNSKIREINFFDLDFVQIGSVTDDINKTGATVLYFPHEGLSGCDISGGGPASRETPITYSETVPTPINAIVLSGGSAYGLEASNGVMKYLEEKDIGTKVNYAIVPIVLQSCIFDLLYGSHKIRPDIKMGYEACKNAYESTKEILLNKVSENIKKCDICKNKNISINNKSNELICNNCTPLNIKNGCYGGGTGATIGKLHGMKYARKSGIGFAAYEYPLKNGILYIGAVVIVNSLGDIYDRNNKLLLGLKDSLNSSESRNSNMEIYNIDYSCENTVSGNTTIGAIVTNAVFNKGELNKLASMTRTAFCKCIRPVGTSFDGDSIYFVSSGSKDKQVHVNINQVGTLAILAMETAIENAAKYSSVTDEEFNKNIIV